MTKKQMEKNQAIIDKFNTECPVGTPVIVEKDDGSTVETTVKYQATVLGGHTPVGWFNAISGAYDLSRAKKSASAALV